MIAHHLFVFVLLRWLCTPASATPAPAPCAAAVPHSDLPSPPPGSTARLVVRGTGTQNYSCTNAVPSGQGAVASLLDITCLRCPRQCVEEDGVARHDGAAYIGRHYFTQHLVPVFDMTEVETPFAFFATKAANVASPDGPGARAIDWLYLTPDSAAPNNGGVRAVYRVSTAGGLPELPCTGSQQVSYTADYWFFF
jgi:hypothetical protein